MRLLSAATLSRVQAIAFVCLFFAVLVHSYGPGRGGRPWDDDDGDDDDGYWSGWNGDNDDDDGNGNGNGFFGGEDAEGVLGFDINEASYYRYIHGILASVAFVILFPLGSILMRVLPGRLALFAHAIFQILSFIVYIAAAGLGIYLVSIVQFPFNGGNLLSNEATSYHPIIGLVILAFLVPQPILGWIHHRRFKAVRRRQLWSYLHLFNGRILITIAIINGGLGLHIAGASDYRKRVYIIVAAVMWGLWMLVAVFSEIRRLRTKGGNKGAPVSGSEAVPRRRPVGAGDSRPLGKLEREAARRSLSS